MFCQLNYNSHKKISQYKAFNYRKSNRYSYNTFYIKITLFILYFFFLRLLLPAQAAQAARAAQTQPKIGQKGQGVQGESVTPVCAPALSILKKLYPFSGAAAYYLQGP